MIMSSTIMVEDMHLVILQERNNLDKVFHQIGSPLYQLVSLKYQLPPQELIKTGTMISHGFNLIKERRRVGLLDREIRTHSYIVSILTV